MRKILLICTALLLAMPGFSGAQAADRGWIAISNGYAKQLTDVAFAHHPEAGSQQGLSQFDTKVSQPTLADEEQERQETEAVLAKLKAAAAQKSSRKKSPKTCRS